MVIMFLVQMSMADWPEASRKQNYTQCLLEVSDFKDGYLEDPLLAHDVCVCVIDILEENLAFPDDALITKFVDNNIEKFYACRDEYQRRRKLNDTYK